METKHVGDVKSLELRLHLVVGQCQQPLALVVVELLGEKPLELFGPPPGPHRVSYPNHQLLALVTATARRQLLPIFLLLGTKLID